jgi:hypothetical protein
MRLTVNLIANGRIYKVGEEVPDDEVPLSLRRYAYANGDLNNPIPSDDGDGITGTVIRKPARTKPSPNQRYVRRGTGFRRVEEQELVAGERLYQRVGNAFVRSGRVPVPEEAEA